MSSAVTATASQTIEKHNPQTGELLYTITEPSSAELGAVMDRARQVFPTLRAMSVADRVKETLKISEYMLENRQHIAEAIVRENGKSMTDALIGDVFTCLDLIGYYKKTAPKILADQKASTPLMLMGKKSKIMYCPLGPVLVISPWNYPVNTALTPAICAFLAGNPVIMKPSEWTPLKGVLDTIITESGVLKDAFQVVQGGRDTGRQLIDLKPAKVFFTGSVRGGKEILKHAGDSLIPVELELGGKDPMIVFADANMERATNGAVWGALNNTGQGCTSVERCFVEASAYDGFVETLKEKFAKLSTSDTRQAPDHGELELGAITTGFQKDKILDQIADARNKGADVWMAYQPKDSDTSVPPTVITGVNNTMAVQVEETFGPVITVEKFTTENEAIELANDTEYGLSSSVWTSDLTRADRVARAIEAGNCCINDVMVSEGNTALPFGGVKQSGIGRYKGSFGLHSFSNIKSIMSDPGKKHAELHWYPYSKQKYHLLSEILEASEQGGLGGFIKLGLKALKLEGLVKRERNSDPDLKTQRSSIAKLREVRNECAHFSASCFRVWSYSTQRRRDRRETQSLSSTKKDHWPRTNQGGGHRGRLCNSQKRLMPRSRSKCLTERFSKTGKRSDHNLYCSSSATLCVLRASALKVTGGLFAKAGVDHGFTFGSTQGRGAEIRSASYELRMSGVHENEVSEVIIGAAIEVHKVLGPGLLEGVYEEALCRELALRGLRFERQQGVPVSYKGVKLSTDLRLDLIVEDKVIVDLKAKEFTTKIDYAKTLTYLRLTDKRLGLNINFHTERLIDGVKRIANNL